jgi:hypothetical protein
MPISEDVKGILRRISEIDQERYRLYLERCKLQGKLQDTKHVGENSLEVIHD